MHKPWIAFFVALGVINAESVADVGGPDTVYRSGTVAAHNTTGGTFISETSTLQYLGVRVFR
jgi:hypothetical protein